MIPYTAIRAILLMLAAVSLYGCGQKHDYTPVPLPYGYQRIEIYPAEYSDADSLPASYAVNASAQVRRLPDGPGGSVMADIDYPAYGATLHLTFTPVDSITAAEVIANRRERMALNLADNYATVSEVGPNDRTPFVSTVMMSAGRTPTPVQILSVGPDMVISGAVRFASEQADADSLMPVLKAITADIEYAASNLH
ncbi:MAG: hypothetical protein K2H74_01570 [Paramuribaculum sp.]|nr:hypothetical protein [Paramuribaculum sp.]